jgi:hypothetical protein
MPIHAATDKCLNCGADINLQNPVLRVEEIRTALGAHMPTARCAACVTPSKQTLAELAIGHPYNQPSDNLAHKLTAKGHRTSLSPTRHRVR